MYRILYLLVWYFLFREILLGRFLFCLFWIILRSWSFLYCCFRLCFFVYLHKTLPIGIYTISFLWHKQPLCLAHIHLLGTVIQHHAFEILLQHDKLSTEMVQNKAKNYDFRKHSLSNWYIHNLLCCLINIIYCPSIFSYLNYFLKS